MKYIFCRLFLCNMSFLTDIHLEIETEFEGKSKKDHLDAFYTLINYLDLVDNDLGIQRLDIRDKFRDQKEYRCIIQKLVSHKVLEKSQNDKFRLNNEAKKKFSLLFNELSSITFKREKTITLEDPVLKNLYNFQTMKFNNLKTFFPLMIE